MNNQRFFFPSNTFTARQPPASQSEHPGVSEQRYRRLFETKEDGMFILDASTLKITDANPYLAGTGLKIRASRARNPIPKKNQTFPRNPFHPATHLKGFILWQKAYR
jgi:hypothetical protein